MRSTQPDKRDDIVVIPENKADACDYIIGDVHGSASSLKKVCDLLKNEADRLFIVGDLTDRGENSVETIRFIHEFNASRPSGKIHCIRGNHEDLCLGALSALEQLTLMLKNADDDTRICMYLMSLQSRQNKSLSVMLENKTMNSFTHELVKTGELLFSKKFGKRMSKHPDLNKIMKRLSKFPKLKETYDQLHPRMTQLYNDLVNHSLNGGRWLSELYLHELSNGNIRVTDGGVKYADSSDTSMIKSYMNSLPYIIHVTGDRPFHIVHADLPMNDDELQKRINSGNGLTRTEIEYATLARASDRAIPIKKIEGRNQFSIPCYVGHSVKGGIRAETNTFNLDIGAYHTDALLVVNHTKGTCLLADNSQEKNTDSLKEIITQTQELLDRQHTLPQTKPELSKSSSSYFHRRDHDKSTISISTHKSTLKK